YANQLKEQSDLIKTVLAKLIPKALAGDFENYLADANSFMDLLSTIVIGWQWLKIATTACKNGNATQLENNLIQTMAYFYTYEMAKLDGLVKILLNDKSITVKADAQTFD
ncbi:MAG: acyl-CoA dehydrogenase, partial [Zetaproteobacteria bacterium]|nr:acyl-CoA dehydrogenase [Flavobacteriales bacterium]